MKASVVVLLILVVSCTNYLTDPQKIIDRSIEAAGGDRYIKSTIEFDFQQNHFTLKGSNRLSCNLSCKDSVASANPFICLALLSYGQNDSSVRPKYLGDTMIENQIFYRVEIACTQKGGDTDFQDVFQYWINRDDFTLGYIANSFRVSNQPGLYFRKAIKPRKVNGIRFYDFITYKPKNTSVKMEEMELLFAKGELEEVGKIELQNIVVY